MKTILNNQFTKALMTFVFLFSINSTFKAQPVLPPFVNTWYGFNTFVNSQPYFLTSSRIVDIDNDGDSDVASSKYWGGFSGTANGFVVLEAELFLA